MNLSLLISSFFVVCISNSFINGQPETTPAAEPEPTHDLSKDIPLVLPLPTVNSTVSPLTTARSTVGRSTCEIHKAIQCLRKGGSKNAELMQKFTIGGFQNITAWELTDICTSLQDVYYCIGNKLDNCAEDVRLLRDVILSATRYICNEKKEAFLNNMGCLNKLAATNTTMNCMNGSLRTEIGKFFTGAKNVYVDNKHFCRLTVNWTSCYMNAVSSLCSIQEYNFVYQYLEHAYTPIQNSLRCNLLSEVELPYAPTATEKVKLLEPTNTVKLSEPEPTPDVSTEPTNETISSKCKYIGVDVNRSDRRRLTQWCILNCNRDYCPSSLCKCEGESPHALSCRAIGVFESMIGMNDWCNYNCRRNHCPQNACLCSKVSP